MPARAAEVPEHAFNWDVAQRVREALRQMGAHVEMSRGDDNSVGPASIGAPLNDAQAGPAVQLAGTMRDSLAAAGLQVNSAAAGPYP